MVALKAETKAGERVVKMEVSMAVEKAVYLVGR